ncbi:MAG: magnesium transporter [Armatimonadia bacterium]|nr:magnesium transporter [Armatimonadia bacterium]
MARPVEKVEENRGSEHASDVAEAIRAATRSEVRGALEGLISGYHPIDIAWAMGELTAEERARVFELLDSDASGVVLEEVDDRITADLAESTDECELAEIIDAMPPDSGADAMNVLPEDVKHRILNRIPPDEAQELAALLDYSEESAGGLMTTEILVSPPDITAKGILQHIRRTNVSPEAVFRVYVVDDDRTLLGAVDLVDIINARDDHPLSKIMNRDPVRVHHDTDQEEVVRQVDKYDLTSIPVVDDADHLLGAVTVDDVIDALQREATEDVGFMAGSTIDDLQSRSPWVAARSRIPWLLLSLLTGMLSVVVVQAFEGTLEEAVMLAAFIPIVLAMASNAGLQSSMVTVRALALGFMDARGAGRMLWRQVPASVLVAIPCGLVAWGAGAVTMDEPQFGVIVGVGMFFAMSIGGTLGSAVPLAFNRFGVDPAIASGPLFTTLNDAIALLVYFGTAVALMQFLA